MSGNRTFTMIKPDAVEAGNIGNIIQMITDAGFSIKAMKLTQLSTEQAQEFYAVHSERPFYGELVEYMMHAGQNFSQNFGDTPNSPNIPKMADKWACACKCCI